MPTATAPKDLKRLIAGTYGTQLLLLPISFITSALQARMLGPDGRGKIATILTVASIATLYLSFGVTSATTYFVASLKISPKNLRPSLAKLGAGSLLTFAVVLGIITKTSAAPIVLGSVEPAIAAPSALVLFALMTHNNWTSAIQTGRRDFSRANAITLLCATAALTLYAIGTWIRPTTLSPVLLAIAIQIAIESLRAVLLASSVWRRSLAEEATIPHVDSPLRLMIEYSLLAYACDAVHFLTYRLDVWVVRAYAGDAQLGHYDLAVRLAELVWLLAGAIAAVLFPSVANMEREDALRTVCRLGMFSVVASTVLALVGWALALVLLPRIFGSAFAPSTALLGVLLLGIVPTSGAKIIGNYLAGTGGMRFSLYSAIVGMIACVSLDFLLIPKRGALGAAIASALTYNIFTVTLFAFFKHSTQLSLPQILRYARGRSTP